MTSAGDGCRDPKIGPEPDKKTKTKGDGGEGVGLGDNRGDGILSFALAVLLPLFPAFYVSDSKCWFKRLPKKTLLPQFRA